MSNRASEAAAPPPPPATPRAPGPGGPLGRHAWPFLVAALLAAIVLGAYAAAFDHKFVNWDDPEYVTENPLTLGKRYDLLLRAVVSHHFHPLTMLSLAWNVSSPLSPRPFIATNVALHVYNTLLVFWLVLLLSGRRLPVAAFVALLFGIHPMHVESVAWIAERKDVLHAFFYLGGVIAYWHHLERPKPWLLLLTFALFVLSCLSKGAAVTFPLALLMLDLWRRRPLRDRRLILEKLPFLGVSLLFGVVVMDVQAGGDLGGLLTAPAATTARVGGADDGDLWRRIATPAHSYMTYVWRLFVPVGLSAIYPYPFARDAAGPWLLAGPAFLVATVGLAVWDLRRTRLIAFAVGWFLATIALTLQWVPVGPTITQSIPIGWAVTADRYTYLPYLGPFFALAMSIEAAFRRNRALGAALWGAGLLFAGFLLVQARRQIETWSSSESLWSRTIEVHPGLALAYVYRGKDRDASGRTREAARDFRRAFDLGLRNADVNEGLGSTSVALGMLDSAAVQFDRAVRADPSRGRSYYNRAVVSLRLGRPIEAVADLDTALARLPSEAATLFGARGYAHLQRGDCRAALPDFDRAIAGGTRDPGVHYGRGRCRIQLGDAAGAVEDFRRTLRLDPGHEGARARLDALRQ